MCFANILHCPFLTSVYSFAFLFLDLSFSLVTLFLRQLLPFDKLFKKYIQFTFLYVNATCLFFQIECIYLSRSTLCDNKHDWCIISRKNSALNNPGGSILLHKKIWCFSVHSITEFLWIKPNKLDKHSKLMNFQSVRSLRTEFKFIKQKYGTYIVFIVATNLPLYQRRHAKHAILTFVLSSTDAMPCAVRITM